MSAGRAGFAVRVCLLAVGLLVPAAHGQFYTETFDDWLVNDFNNGYCQVRWCYADDLASAVSCSAPVSLRMVNSTDDVLIWVCFGTEGCTQARIDFNYAQWQSSPPQPDLSDARLKYATSSSTTLSCTTGVNGLGPLLNRTYGTTPQCFAASHTATLTGTNRALYWRFDKGTFPTALYIDDVVITLTGCDCGAGACVTELDEDFGFVFQSGSVCTLFPDTFEACTGAGPYITSGTACGGTGDYVMYFGSGYPYSEATLRCINLAGEAAASLEFNYTKTGGTLGPNLYASLNGTTWTNIWSAPFSFPGGCVAGCADLAAYVGEPEVWLKFSSGTSGTQSHGVDDIHLELGQGCPPECTDPTVDAGPNKPMCPGELVILEGTASGGSGGLCPGDYSPQWSGPGIVSGGDTFTPTVDTPGTYTLTVSCGDCQVSDNMAVNAGLAGDWGADGGVGWDDFLLLAGCLTGPGGGTGGPRCVCGDFDTDGDVDQEDFAAFQNVFGV